MTNNEKDLSDKSIEEKWSNKQKKIEKYLYIWFALWILYTLLGYEFNMPTLIVWIVSYMSISIISLLLTYMSENNS